MSQIKLKIKGKAQFYQASLDHKNETVQINGKQLNKTDLDLDVPITGSIYGTLLNYKGNIEVLGDALFQKPYNEPPKAPILYIKPKNTYIGSGMAIPLPAGIDRLEVGAALGVVIGKTASKINLENAMDLIKGYTIVNDISVPHESYFRPAVKHKARDGFCPIGPWIVNKSHHINPDALAIKVYVNGEIKQENTTSNLIRNVGKLLADITDFMTLQEGDVILVGVPENPPLVKENDQVRIEIEGIGSLENTVILEENLLGRDAR